MFISSLPPATPTCPSLLCHPLLNPCPSPIRLDVPLQNELDVQNLAKSLAGSFMDIIQYAKDNTALRYMCVWGGGVVVFLIWSVVWW